MNALLIALALVAGQGFIDNQTALPGTKINAAPIVGPANENLSASEFNTITAALYDTRTVIERQQSIWSYGAACDGGVDDSAAFTNAFRTLTDAGPNEILNIVNGICRIANISVPIGVTLNFQNNGQIEITDGGQVTFYQPPAAGAWKIFTFNKKQAKPPVVWASNLQAYPAVNFGAPIRAIGQWWGMKGDGNLGSPTDNAPLLQAAINSFGWNPNPFIASTANTGVSGNLEFGSGHYVMMHSVTMGAGSSGLTLEGAGTGSSYASTQFEWRQTDGTPGLIIAGEQMTAVDGGPVIAIATTTQARVKDIMLWSNGVAGPTASIGEIGGASQILFDGDAFLTYSTNYPTVSIDVRQKPGYYFGGNVEGIEFRNSTFSVGSGMTKPIVYVVGTGIQNDGGIGGGQVADLTFTSDLFNGSLSMTAPFFHLENADQTGYGLANIIFQQDRMEVPYAGLFYILGAQQVKLQNIEAGDTAQASIAPLIYIAPAFNASPTVSLEAFWTDMGTARYPTVQFGTPSFGGLLTIKDSQFPNVAASGPGQVVAINSQIASFADAGYGQWYPLEVGGTGILDGGSGAANWGIEGIWGLSHTETPAFNFRGHLTVSSGQTTGTASFGSYPESDNNYFLSLTPTANNLATYAITGIAKSTTGFTITIATTAASNVTYDWILVR